MTYPVGWLGRFTVALAVCGSLGTGCWYMPSPAADGGMDDECEYDTSGSLRAESDNGLITAAVDCDANVDCSADVRAVLRGTQLEYTIRVAEPYASTRLRAESTDEDVIALTFDSIEGDPCDGAIFLHGTASFDALGEAAVVVYDGDDEVDRFELSVHDAARIELQAGDGIDPFALAESDYETFEQLSIASAKLLRMRVLNEAGERLLGADRFSWEIDDGSKARLQGGTSVRAMLEPLEVGTATLTIRSSGLTLDIPLEITD